MKIHENSWKLKKILSEVRVRNNEKMVSIILNGMMNDFKVKLFDEEKKNKWRKKFIRFKVEKLLSGFSPKWIQKSWVIVDLETAQHHKWIHKYSGKVFNFERVLKVEKQCKIPSRKCQVFLARSFFLTHTKSIDFFAVFPFFSPPLATPREMK